MNRPERSSAVGMTKVRERRRVVENLANVERQRGKERDLAPAAQSVNGKRGNKRERERVCVCADLR